MFDPRATAQLKTCPYCDSPVVAGNRFCLQCGNPLTSEGAPVADAPEEPAVSASRVAAPAEVVSAVAVPTIDPTWRKTGYRALSLLAERVDGWGTVAFDKGELAPLVEERFKEQLLTHKMPNIVYDVTTFVSNNIKAREYLVVRSPSQGGRVTVHINQFGRDLYLAWDIWIMRRVNLIVAACVFGLSTLCGPLFWGLVALRQIFALQGSALLSIGAIFLLYIANLLFFGGIVGGAGWFLKKDWLAFFLIYPDHLEVQDLRAMMIVSDLALRSAADSVGIAQATLRAKQQYGGERLGGVI